MKTSEHPGVLLLACKRDGAPGTGPAERCGLCGRAKVEFVSSAGLRRLCPTLPERETVCVNAKGPCLNALYAKKWLTASEKVTA